MSTEEDNAKAEIASLLARIYELRRKNERFVPGKTKIRYAFALYDDQEVVSMLEAILEGWFGIDKRAAAFESELSSFLGLKGGAVTNSGSSANLLTVAALCSPLLEEKRPMRPGDEVVTSPTTFPTTVNPIFQNQLVPVFVDINPRTLNLDPEHLQKAVTNRTRAIMVPHMVGIPNQMDYILEFAEKHDLFVIEDTCDALGSKFNGRYLGSFGTASTFSFYAAHHISMGEGGAVSSAYEDILGAVRSLRDWGRILDIKDGEKALRRGRLPEDYDPRFVYVTIGYNLKPTEIQVAKGLIQLRRLPGFIESRKRNYETILDGISKFANYFEFAEPPPNSDVSWFAFPLTLKTGAPFSRRDFRAWFDKHNIDTRQMLAGNIIRHPAYDGLKYRVATSLTHADNVMKNSFFFGVHPGLREEHLSYIIEKFEEFVKIHTS